MLTLKNRFSSLSTVVILLIGFSPLEGFSQATLLSEMDQLKWKKVVPGVWKASFGEMGLNPIDYANSPKIKAINELGDAPFPFDKDEAYSNLTPSLASIRIPLGAHEQIYGLGLEFEGMNRRSNVYSLKVDHYGGTKGYTHAPVPFYISSEGYGVLINSAQRVKIHVGVGNRKDSNIPKPIDRTTGENWAARPLSDAVEASAQGNGMEIYVFAGNSNLEVVQRYNLFFGGGIIPPKWGLGFWHRMNTSASDKEVMKEVQDFDDYNFPLDVIGLEPGWQSFAYPCSFDWDTGRFPEPEKFVKALDSKGIKVNLWENPYVAPSSSMYNDMSPYTGSHTVWLGEVPDYTMPEAQEVLLNHHKKNHLDYGVTGYKFDEVDGYDVWLWPDHATFPSGNDAVEIRQLYGMMLQKMFDGYFKEQNTRTYNLIRSAYIGASSHNFVLYSDYYDHKGYVTALANSSLSGLLWTPEVRNAETGEEWVRRFQSVSFSPLMMLNAWSSGKKPWSFPEVTDMVRNTIDLRMQLLPYLYTAFYEYSEKGIPPFRAMVLENGYNTQEIFKEGELDGTINPYAEGKRIEVTDQYMMGPSILVAPVFTGEKERDIVLPNGNWFDFYTGDYAGNGETITIKTKLEEIPLYVKDGGIIPMLTNTEKNTQSQALNIRHYGNKESSFVVYNDDGISFDYENGVYSLTELTAKKRKKGKFSGSSKSLNNTKFKYDTISWSWMTELK